MKEAIIIIFLVIIAFLIMQSISLKEHFTELYFNNPKSLPTIMKTNETYNFSFSIVSHEKEQKEYVYSITSELISEKKNITLNPGENITMTRTVKSQNINEGNFTVFIENSNQSIHFFYVSG